MIGDIGTVLYWVFIIWLAWQLLGFVYYAALILFAALAEGIHSITRLFGNE